jgi:hypothetical protein
LLTDLNNLSEANWTQPLDSIIFMGSLISPQQPRHTLKEMFMGFFSRLLVSVISKSFGYAIDTLQPQMFGNHNEITTLISNHFEELRFALSAQALVNWKLNNSCAQLSHF